MTVPYSIIADVAATAYLDNTVGQAGDTRDECLVSVGLDLMATCCDYARAPQPEHCLGFSLRSVAEATDTKASVPRKYVYCENQVSYCVADTSWKYVLYDHVSGPLS